MEPADVAHITTAFVGRENEVNILNGYLEDLNLNQGRLVFLIGEAGIGKTRLVQEVGKTAMESGIQFLVGRCISQQHADPYLPFIDALGISMRGSSPGEINGMTDMPMGMAGMGSVDDYDEEESDLPLGLLPMAREGGTSVTEQDMAGQRDRMFNTIADMIRARAESKPLFIFLDDMQYADTATLQLLFYVARSLKNSKVLLCCAYRPEELGTHQGQAHPLTQMLRRMSQEKLQETVQLNSLSLGEIEDVVKSILVIEEVPSGFLNKLYDESEGNPFFVEEVLKSLMDEGIIKRHAHIWDAGVNLSSIRIPNTIKDVISHRIARMDEKSKKVLRYASVIGTEFQFDVLLRATEMNSEELLDVLDHLIEVEMIHEDTVHDEEGFLFGHKQTRMVIYEAMSKSRIRIMHLKVGNIIEELYRGRLKDVIFSLSRHFTMGKDFVKSHRYSKQAGAAAMESFAFEDATDYFSSALRTLNFLGDDAGIDIKKEGMALSFQLGDLEFAMGNPAAAGEHYRTALQNSQALGDKAAEAEAYLYIGHSERLRGNFHISEEMYEKAIAHFETTGNNAGLAGGQRGLGYVHWRKGENDEAVEHYKESISYSMKAGDEHGMGMTYIDLGNVYTYWGDYEKGMEYYNKSILPLEKVKDFNELARAYNNMGDCHIKLKNYQEALDNFEKCKQSAEKIGNKNFIAWGLFNSAEVLAYLGEYDKAENYCVRALQICEELDDRVGMNGIFKNFGIIYRLKKEWDKSIENFNKSIVILEMLDIPYELGITYADLARTYEDMDEIEEALESYRMAVELLNSIGSSGEVKELENKIKELEG